MAPVPGLRTGGRRCRLVVRGLAGVAAAFTAATLAGCGGHPAQAAGAADGASDGATSSSEEPYGSLPTFLPPATIHPDAVLTGTVARPALTTEGDSVRVAVGASTATVTVSGPDVPGEGLPNAPDTTTCTWTVTVSAGGGPVSFALADFTTLDEKGEVFHPHLAPGSPPAPQVRAGRSATFELRAVMPTGHSVMRWAPGGGGVAAMWDFVVEND